MSITQANGISDLELLNQHATSADETITGIVNDETGAGLPGVSVVVKGTQRGTTTNKEGRFTLTVPNNTAVLVFSFVGYQPQEVTVGSQTQINISMKTDAKALGEVIVVGYGTHKKANLTGAVDMIVDSWQAKKQLIFSDAFPPFICQVSLGKKYTVAVGITD